MPQAATPPLVLVIDDDRDTRELYRFALDIAGYQVAEAADIEEAARLTSSLRPDVALCDWRLPDGDGDDLARRLRALPGARHLPLVAVTGVTLAGDALERVRRNGFERVLVKPALPDVILDAVRQVVEARQKTSLRRAILRLTSSIARARRRDEPFPVPIGPFIANASNRIPAGVALLVADDDARYVASNGAASMLTGYPQVELERLTVWDLTPLPNAAKGHLLWSAFIASGFQEGRYTLRRREGSLVEAPYCAVANVAPGLHVSALLAAATMPEPVAL